LTFPSRIIDRDLFKLNQNNYYKINFIRYININHTTTDCFKVVVPGVSERLNDEKGKRKGPGMSPKRAFLSAFSFTLLHCIRSIEETIKTHELVAKVR